MLDAVILDLGNVLVFHDNQLLFEKLAEAFATTPTALKARLDDDVWEKVNTGKLPGDALRQQLEKNLGGRLTPDEFYRLWNCHFTLNLPMVQRVEALVGKVKLALLSNTHDQHIRFLWPQLPVLERFDAVVLSYQEGLIKPSAELYRRALERLEVKPDRAVFFDDVQRYADGASAVGIHGRLFSTVADFELQLSQLGGERLS